MPTPLTPIRQHYKAHELCLRLTAMAQQMGPGGRFPRVTELCASLDVSPTTLNGALNVLEVQQVIRRRRGSGIFVADDYAVVPAVRRTALICNPTYVSPANGSPFWDLMIESSRERATQGHAELELYFSRVEQLAPEKALYPNLRTDIAAGEVHGVFSLGLPIGVTRWIEAQGVPVVAYAGPAAYMVGTDETSSHQIAIEELARRGCRRIGFWDWLTPNFYETSAAKLMDRFGRTLTACRLEVLPGLYRSGRFHAPDNTKPHELSPQEQGYNIALEVFGEPRSAWPDGIYIGHDLMTVGALAALDTLGLRAGRDVQLATHANEGSPLLLGRENQLVFVDVQPRRIVEGMFSLLEKLMAGEKPEAHVVRYPCILRQSPATELGPNGGRT